MPYRRIFGPSLILSLSLLAAPLLAQMHHVDQPQQVTRALGVYEWTGSLTKPNASRLIPVSLFIHGQFQDAGVYLAQPVPLALETGNVYAIQRSGDPIGTLDLDFARDVVDPRDRADDNPLGAWYGYGRFLPLSAEPKPALHPSVQLSAIVSSGDDSLPHFIDRTPKTLPGSGSGSGKTGSTPAASSPALPDDPNAPILHRAPNSGSDSTDSTASTGNAPASPGTASNPENPGNPDDDPYRPTLGHRDQQPNEKHHHRHAGDVGAVIPMSTSLNDDPNAPILHRGKMQSQTAAPALTGLPPDMHQAIAVSDPVTRQTHVFARPWDSPTERADTLAAMEKLAQPFARQYMTINRLQPAPASTGPKLLTNPASASPAKTHPSTRPARHRAVKPKPTPLVFQEEQLSGFTLSYGGLPTFVFSASIPTAAIGPVNGPEVHVTVVAQRLPEGNLQLSLDSVTDDNHLDRTPWMRLVDAVDADASHRASLLFELRERGGRQFALYSLAYARARQTFVTGIIE